MAEAGKVRTGHIFPSYSVEGRIPDSFFSPVWGNPPRRKIESVVIDPPDGKIPYTLWGAMKSGRVLRTPLRSHEGRAR